MTTQNLPNYHPILVGENALTHQVVCKDGQIRQVRTEQFSDGFHAYIDRPNGRILTNDYGYKTVRKALNAAAKW
jgi:hypothetical protein